MAPRQSGATGGTGPPRSEGSRRGDRPVVNLGGMTSSDANDPASAPRRYTVVLRPSRPEGGTRGILRTALVDFTGELGTSGYPRYEGEGVQADIDPETRTVETVTLDGTELPYGWTAQIAEG